MSAEKYPTDTQHDAHEHRMAGALITLSGSLGGEPVLVLNGPDSDGFGRVAPLQISHGPTGLGYAVDLADYTDGGQVGWLRLDRASWVSIEGERPLARFKPDALARVLRLLCVTEARGYAQVAHAPKAFLPGKSPVPPSGKVIGARELELLVEASLDGWLTTGRFNDAFERKLGHYIGRKFVRTTNSGSSANLVALTALTSPLLGERALRPGDEVLTVAAGFPTTVNPSLQNGLVPVFVDVKLGTYNIDSAQIESAISAKTRAIMIAHTLGNPFDLDTVMDVAKRHNLWVVEDCCDALGATYRGRKVGTFGHVGTLSFYPAHHITMGEGGAVFSDDEVINRAVESIRDWGRDCYCAPGRDNTCGKRFGWQLGDLPTGYDHKYTYSHLGYNLKITDMQAAVGLAQLDRLEGFVEARRNNFSYLKSKLGPLADRLILPEPTPHSDPSWFGFPISVKPEAGKRRDEITKHLERQKIGTRLLFAGNLTRQPYFAGRQYRVSGSLENSDRVMNETFWVGIYPGLSRDMLDFTAEQIAKAL